MRLADSVLEELWFADDDPRFSHEVASRSMAASLATSLALKPFPRAGLEGQREAVLLAHVAPGLDHPLRRG